MTEKEICIGCAIKDDAPNNEETGECFYRGSIYCELNEKEE